jgi:hypothetical protein
MRIIITEEQKNNLFKPRNLDSRYDVWNKQQPEITIDGHNFLLNQYDSEGSEIGVWVESPKTIEQDYIKTKSFMKNIFDQLEVKQSGKYTNYMIDDNIYFQDPKNGYLRVNCPRIWEILEDQYSLSYEQMKGLIRVWMEITYKLGSLKPFDSFLLDKG